MQTKLPNYRLVLVCVAAAATGLPIAMVSLAKILLMLGTLLILLVPGQRSAFRSMETPQYTRATILVVLLAFGTSIAWTTAPIYDAIASLGKYGKLLFIVLVFSLIQNRKEALYALSAFLLAQLCVVLSSWMLFLHVPVPWATSTTARLYSSVFSSYLDQGIMSAVFASICWHLRDLLPGKRWRFCAVMVAVLALLNVFFVLIGRTGHVVAIALISLAIAWELPRQYRKAIALVPVLVIGTVILFSPKVQSRLVDVNTEVQAFFTGQGSSVIHGTSSGIRLHFWQRALQSMAEHPFLGTGVGSWSTEFNRLEKQKSSKPESIPSMGNPHQEYLLWGVQLGAIGIVLIAALFLSICRDTAFMDKASSRATCSILLALIISCLFNATIYDALIGDFFCLTLGIMFALGFQTVRADKTAQVAE